MVGLVIRNRSLLSKMAAVVVVPEGIAMNAGVASSERRVKDFFIVKRKHLAGSDRHGLVPYSG